MAQARATHTAIHAALVGNLLVASAKFVARTPLRDAQWPTARTHWRR